MNLSLSKMAGLNISLNRRQSSSDKKHNLSDPFNLSLRLVLLSPFAVVLSALYSFLNRQETNETIPLQFPRCLLPFLREKLLEKIFSRWKKRRCKLQASIKGGPVLARNSKLTHLCGFWLDISCFTHVKKHRSRFLLDVSFFSRVWKPSFASLFG